MSMHKNPNAEPFKCFNCGADMKSLRFEIPCSFYFDGHSLYQTDLEQPQITDIQDDWFIACMECDEMDEAGRFINEDFDND